MAASSPTECSVCWESFSDDLIKITCPQCLISTCSQCMFSFIEGKSIMPSCSKTECGFVYDEAFLSSVLPDHMRKDIRNLVKRVLVDQEKARLPQATADINQNGSPLMKPRARYPNSKKCAQLRAEITKLKLELERDCMMAAILSNPHIATTTMKFDQVTNEYIINNGQSSSKIKIDDVPAYIKQLSEQCQRNNELIQAKSLKYKELKTRIFTDYRGNPISKIEYDEHMAQNRQRPYFRGAASDSSSERRNFVMPCGREGCDGFLSTRWRCMRCDQYRCPDCHVNLDTDTKDQHVCNPDDVATAKTIMAETKACPKCGTRIQRSHGCDHMWCTECNTSFLYSSGRVIPDSHNTNPHYHMWRQSQGAGGNILQNVCPQDAGFISEFHLSCLMFGLGLATYEVAMALELRMLIEPQVGNRPPGFGLMIDESLDEDKAENRRHEFILGLITEEQLRNRLFLSYRRNERKKHHNDIVRTIRAAGAQILLDIMAATTAKQARRHIQAIGELLRFANESYLRINTQLLYTTTPIITKYFQYVDLVPIKKISTYVPPRPSAMYIYRHHLTEYCAWSHMLRLRELPDPETRIRMISSGPIPRDVARITGMSVLTDDDLDYTQNMIDVRPRPEAKASLRGTGTTKTKASKSKKPKETDDNVDDADIDALLDEIDFYIVDE